MPTGNTKGKKKPGSKSGKSTPKTKSGNKHAAGLHPSGRKYKIGYQKKKSREGQRAAAKKRHDMMMRATGRGDLVRGSKKKKKS